MFSKKYPAKSIQSGGFVANSRLVRGFSLIELILTAAIISLMMTFIVTTFSKSRVNLDQEVNLIVANIRNAQNLAVAAKTLDSDGSLRCGYGIEYDNPTSYSLYAGENASSVDCSAQDRRRSGVGDVIVKTYTINNPKVEFVSSFDDFFFEPPDPKTYLCVPLSGCFQGGLCRANCALPNLSPITITVRKVGASCPGVDCRTINVYTSGRVEVQ